MVFLWKWILQPEPAWWRSQWLVRAVQPRPSLPRRWSNGSVSCQGSPAATTLPANVGSGWYLDILLFHAFLGHWEWRKALTPGQRKNTQDIRNIFGIFFSVRISHGMENRSWNLCWVRSLLHLVELTHKVEWSKGKLTHKEKLWCWYDIGWAQGKWEGKQDDDWSLLIVSSEALVVTPFWLFLFNLPA